MQASPVYAHDRLTPMTEEQEVFLKHIQKQGLKRTAQRDLILEVFLKHRRSRVRRGSLPSGARKGSDGWPDNGLSHAPFID